ncbi:MAG TPA: hypothetical protein PK720_01285 [bacterium]|nr:hypothetical protein [bacterium]
MKENLDKSTNSREVSDIFVKNLKSAGFNKYKELETYDLEEEAKDSGVHLGVPLEGSQPTSPKLFQDIQSAYQYVLNSSLPHRLDVVSLEELKKDYLRKNLNPDDKQLALNVINYLQDILPKQ